MEKQFTDSDTEVVGFSRSCPNNRVETKDSGTSTTEVILHDRHLQTVEKQHAEVQTDAETVPAKPQYDEKALLEFMLTHSPILERQIKKWSKSFSFERSLTGDEEVATKKIASLPKHENIEKFEGAECLCVSWSRFGNKIAACFIHRNNSMWCRSNSFILIFERDKNEEFTQEAKVCIDINTRIVDLKFHPTFNSVIVFATDEGKIYWHSTSESPESNSKNYFYHKTGRITQISWVELDFSHYLVIADSECYMNLWTTSSSVEDWKLWKKFTLKSPEDTICRSVLAFDFSKLGSPHFVVAMEGGRLVQCTITSSLSGDTSSNPVVTEFEKTVCAIIGVHFAEFEDNIFLTSSLDHKLRIYQLNVVTKHEKKKAPICVVVDRCVPLVSVNWNPVQENIFKTLSRDGEIQFYDYRLQGMVKSIKLDQNISAAGFHVKGMKQLLAAVDCSRNITVWQMTLFAR